MGRKIYVTAAEMLELRRQGLSNHDIAKSLDISLPTVLRYIGRQDGKMEGLSAFKDTPPRKKEQEEAVKPMIPKYEPKALLEKFQAGDCIVEIDVVARSILITGDDGEILLPYESIPDLVQFLAWAMRTRMEVNKDGETEQVRESDGDSERREV